MSRLVERSFYAITAVSDTSSYDLSLAFAAGEVRGALQRPQRILDRGHHQARKRCRVPPEPPGAARASPIIRPAAFRSLSIFVSTGVLGCDYPPSMQDVAGSNPPSRTQAGDGHSGQAQERSCSRRAWDWAKPTDCPWAPRERDPAWRMEPVFRAGETFPHDPAITEAEAEVA